MTEDKVQELFQFPYGNLKRLNKVWGMFPGLDEAFQFPYGNLKRLNVEITRSPGGKLMVSIPLREFKAFKPISSWSLELGADTFQFPYGNLKRLNMMFPG